MAELSMWMFITQPSQWSHQHCTSHSHHSGTARPYTLSKVMLHLKIKLKCSSRTREGRVTNHLPMVLQAQEETDAIGHGSSLQSTCSYPAQRCWGGHPLAGSGEQFWWVWSQVRPAACTGCHRDKPACPPGDPVVMSHHHQHNHRRLVYMHKYSTLPHVWDWCGLCPPYKHQGWRQASCPLWDPNDPLLTSLLASRNVQWRGEVELHPLLPNKGVWVCGRMWVLRVGWRRM